MLYIEALGICLYLIVLQKNLQQFLFQQPMGCLPLDCVVNEEAPCLSTCTGEGQSDVSDGEKGLMLSMAQGMGDEKPVLIFREFGIQGVKEIRSTVYLEVISSF